MPLNRTKARILCCGLISCLLSNCVHPPYNNFKPLPRGARSVAVGAGTGAVIGAVTTTTLPGTLAGAALGGTLGALITSGKSSKNSIIKHLRKQGIEFIQYGDTMTLIVPVDKYYMFESPRFNELCYKGLLNIVALLKLYPQSPIYVAGFTDNVGTRYHKRSMSQAQAETMLTYLWANNINAQRLKAEGYGDLNTVGDNSIIHGSAMNRRIEIQWFSNLMVQAQAPVQTRPIYSMK